MSILTKFATLFMTEAMPAHRVFENEHVKMEIIEGIVHTHYKKGLKLSLNDAHRLVEEKIRFCGGNDYPFIFYDGGVVSMDRDARMYFSSEEGTRCISIAAFLETSVFSKMLINFFLKLTTPRVRSKAFNELEEAVSWINKYA